MERYMREVVEMTWKELQKTIENLPEGTVIRVVFEQKGEKQDGKHHE